MPRSTGNKGYMLAARLSEADIAIIDRAARSRGRSRADFVRTAAIIAGEDVLMETRTFE